MADVEVTLDEAGDTEEVEVLDLLVKPGDHVQTGQALLEVETDKTNLEVAAPVSGVVVETKVAVGDILTLPTGVLVVLTPDT